MKSLEAQKLKRNLASTRKVHGFEKFNWFITSDGFLALSGRDNNQSDILIKKHLRPGDVFVHADLVGSIPCIVRSKNTLPTLVADSDNAKSVESAENSELVSVSPSAQSTRNICIKPVSPLALQEAANSVVCRSAAWSAKIVTSAWWVPAEQVCKIGAMGEQLQPGIFALLGKKNYLPPSGLEMGFGFMFRVDDASAERHAGDRLFKQADNDDETISLISEASDRYGLDMGFYNTMDGPVVVSSVPLARGFNSGAPAKSISGPASTALASLNSSETGETFYKKNQSKLSEKSSSAIMDRPNEVENSRNFGSRKKASTKKKNKKYANQDEEDYELAMMALGLNGGKKKEKAKSKSSNKKKDLSVRQEEAGIGLLKQDWQSMLEPLKTEVIRI